ncbi:MAG: BatD family protein [Saprospiraceae bacterium]
MKLQNLVIASIFSCATLQIAIAQEATFTAELSRDTVLLGNAVRITFTLENTDGQFRAPDFKGMTQVSGVSQSSSYSMINGVTTQSMTYSYYLEPIKTGKIKIEPAVLETEDGIMKSNAITLIVMDNVNQIQQDAVPDKRPSNAEFPSRKSLPKEQEKKPKTDLKTYKL